MESEALQQVLQAGLEDCEVTVQGDGSHFDILVVGERFEGLSPVKKQQEVYAVINHLIADGSVHAVNIKAITPSEQARPA